MDLPADPYLGVIECHPLGGLDVLLLGNKFDLRVSAGSPYLKISRLKFLIHVNVLPSPEQMRIFVTGLGVKNNGRKFGFTEL